MFKEIKNIFIIVLIFIAVGCECNAPKNLDLEGFWKTDRLVGRQEGKDLDCSRHFWSFQLGISEVQHLSDNGNGKYICRYEFDKKNQKLRMYDFRLKGAQTALTNPDKLKKFGIPSLDVNFDVLRMDGDKLILQSEDYTIYFHSY